MAVADENQQPFFKCKNVRKFDKIDKNVVKIKKILYNYSNSNCKEGPL